MNKTLRRQRRRREKNRAQHHRRPPMLTWDEVRYKANMLAAERGEWGGMPLPINGQKLVVEPRYPNQRLNGAGFTREGHARPVEPEPKDDFKLRNSWFCFQRQSTVYVVEEADGKIRKYLWPKCIRRARDLFSQFEVASQAWSLEAELEAMGKLKAMVTKQAWKYYVSLGMFLETSPRSNVTYVFRRLATTIALGRSRRGDDDMQVLTTLCLHPIGYYEGTPCGVMVPTDDVIAHLTLMRGDEHQFWKKANHHHVWE